MARLPKLKIKLPSGEYICELAEARQYLDFNEGVFMIEQQGVQSFDDIVRIASLDKFKNKEFLEVIWLQVIGGG